MASAQEIERERESVREGGKEGGRTQGGGGGGAGGGGGGGLSLPLPPSGIERLKPIGNRGCHKKHSLTAAHHPVVNPQAVYRRAGP